MKELNLKDILHLSKCVEKKRRGVYFLISNNEIVYVGGTDDFQRRFCQHTSGYGTNQKVFDRYCFIEVKDEHLIPIENKYILLFKPKYNMRINPTKEYITRKIALSVHGIGMTLIKKNISNIRTQVFLSETRYNLEDLLNIQKGNTTSTSK